MDLQDLRDQKVSSLQSALEIIERAQQAGRSELTTADAAAVEAHRTAARAADLEISRIMLGIESGHSSDSNTHRIPVSMRNHDKEERMSNMQHWKNSDGRIITALGKGTSLRSYLQGKGLVSDQDEAPVTFGEIIVAKLAGRYASREVRAATQQLGVDSTGGFLVNPGLSATVIDLARNASVLFQAGAQTIPMDTQELNLVRVATDPTITWTGESQALTASNGTFERVRLRARKMGCIVKISRELAEDSANAAAVVEGQIQQAIALELDRVGLVGTGAGEEPCGVFYHGDVQEISSVGSPTYDDFLDAIEDVELVNGMAPTVIMPPSVKATLAKLKESTTNAYLAPPADYAALQKLVTNQLTSAQAAVGDFAQVLVGIRDGIRIEFSAQAGDSAGSAFVQDEIWIRATWRGDVQFAHPDHIVRLIGIS